MSSNLVDEDAEASEAAPDDETGEDDLTRAGVAFDTFERVDTLSMAEQVQALGAGELDVIQVMEPYASPIVNAGHGHVWHRCSVRARSFALPAC